MSCINHRQGADMTATAAPIPIIDIEDEDPVSVDLVAPLSGYYTEFQRGIIIGFVRSHCPHAFIAWLNSIEKKGKIVFAPTIVNTRLVRLLELRGYVPVLCKITDAQERLIYGDYVEGLAKNVEGEVQL